MFLVSGCGSVDRYVVLGAQRDAWGKGYAKATVGTSVLIELARAVREMVEKGKKCNTACFSQSRGSFFGRMEVRSSRGALSPPSEL